MSVRAPRRRYWFKFGLAAALVGIVWLCICEQIAYNTLTVGTASLLAKADPKVINKLHAMDEMHKVEDNEELPPHNPVCNRPLSRTERSNFVDYEQLVYCTWLGNSIHMARLVLILVLIVLLYLLSSTADSFFCPVLQAIVEKYHIPPDIAGVTFLSFGNGSPDVFSNIAAFSKASPNIAVTSILGGGLLVTTVIAASVGLASQGQDQLIPRKYVRDVVFYGLAILYLCFVVFHGPIHLVQALGFLVLYACYVTTILMDKQIAAWLYKTMEQEYDVRTEYGTLFTVPRSSTSSDNQSVVSVDDLGTPVTMMMPSYHVFQIPQFTTTISDAELNDARMQPGRKDLYRQRSAPTPRATRDPEVAHETLPLLVPRRIKTRRPASVCVSSMKRRTRSVWETTEVSSHFSHTAKRWTRGYHELSQIAEFSSSVSQNGEDDDTQHGDEDENDEINLKTLDEGEADLIEAVRPRGLLESAFDVLDQYGLRWIRVGYQVFDRVIWNPLELSTTFVRRLTIPLVDEGTWDKNLTIVCPPCAIWLVGISVFHMKMWPLSHPAFALVIAIGGGVGSAWVALTAPSENPPKGLALAPYITLAFMMSIVWIMNIASEVLAVLEVLGGLCGISNSVLGVSVLAWGNSTGDLVSNTAIARDGFPTMAFAGCFAGPMFNVLVGIGLALTIAIIQKGPMTLGEPSPLVYVGFTYLLLSLTLNLSVAAYHNFAYQRVLCYLLLGLYASFAIVSIVLVAYTSS